MKIFSYGSGKKGYELLTRSSDAEDKETEAVLKVIKPLKSDNGKDAIRFAPLPDAGAGRYLLTVILRGVTQEGEDRIHYEAVSFLMDGREADKLFGYPFDAIRKAALRIAADISLQRELTGEETEKFFSCVSEANQETRDRPVPQTFEARRALFMAAANARLPNPRGQVAYIYQKPQEAISALSWLLGSLPRSLCKSVSFFLNAVGFSETRNEFLVFLDENDTLRSNDSGGGSVNRSRYANGALDVAPSEAKSVKFADVFLDEQDNFRAKYVMDLSNWDASAATELWTRYHEIAEIFSTLYPTNQRLAWEKVYDTIGAENAKIVQENVKIAQEGERRRFETVPPERPALPVRQEEDDEQDDGQDTESGIPGAAPPPQPSPTPEPEKQDVFALNPLPFFLRNHFVKTAALILLCLLLAFIDITLIRSGMRRSEEGPQDGDPTTGELQISAAQALAERPSAEDDDGAMTISGAVRADGELQANGDNVFQGSVTIRGWNADDVSDSEERELRDGSITLESVELITFGRKNGDSKWEIEQNDASAWEIGISGKAAVSAEADSETEVLLTGTLRITRAGQASGQLSVNETAPDATIRGELSVEGNIVLLGLEETQTQSNREIPVGPYLMISGRGLQMGVSGMEADSFRLLATNALSVIVVILFLSVVHSISAKRKRDGEAPQ